MKSRIPLEIEEKYRNSRKVRFDRKIIGITKEIVGFYEDVGTREYVNIVEKIKLTRGSHLFRFAYWTKKKSSTTWRWGQFCLCLQRKQIEKLYNLMREKGWVS